MTIGKTACIALAIALGVGLAAPAAAKGTLKPFASEAALMRYLNDLKKRMPPPPPPPPAPPMAGAVASAPSAKSDTVVVTGESITNNQVQGVDEGDIIKQHGNQLVILRRGKLFTVSLAGDKMKPVASINAFPPGVDASGDWYDEMLIAGNRIVVIGYSYSRGGTQINRFDIDEAGRLKFVDAYQLRSNDYYSARNYASRLIGTKLIVYSPRYIPFYGDLTVALPALRRWTGNPKAGFQRIGTAREVYFSPGLKDDSIKAVHTVTSCDLMAPQLACKATSVFGPDGNTFYVSQTAVYVWLSSFYGEERSALLYRLPLNGGAPSAIGVRGGPVDQFGFREDADDGMLNVLVRANSSGDAMWTSHFASGDVALLRLPLSSFGDGRGEAARRNYRDLPEPKSGGYDFHNRFAGDYVLYGMGSGWGSPGDTNATLYAAPVRGGDTASLRLPHAVDRIELMGRDAVVVGSDSRNVYFSTVLLGGVPKLGDRYTETDAAQGETRSHGFFFKPEGAGGDGVLGLPVTLPATPGFEQLFSTSAAMLYLRRDDGRFAPLGQLKAHDAGAVDDKCSASCTDWYGNARPIFLGSRTFALMGYELVEGVTGPGTIREVGRVNFAPGGGRR